MFVGCTLLIFRDMNYAVVKVEAIYSQIEAPRAEAYDPKVKKKQHRIQIKIVTPSALSNKMIALRLR